MRIEVRDPRTRRRRIGRIVLESGERPTRARALGGSDAGSAAEVFLNWDSAVDDAGRLRRCVVCGCRDLFQEKAFPQVTGIVIVLAFAGAIAGIFGLVTNVPVLTAMVIVLALDVWILLFSRRRLVCYQCRTSYHDLAIARYHRSWERSVADRHPPPPELSGEYRVPSTEQREAEIDSELGTRNAEPTRRAPRRMQQEGFIA